MSSREVYDENNEFVGFTPVVERETPMGLFVFDWENTKLRRFGEGSEDLNHIEYKKLDGNKIGIFFTDVDDGLVEELDELNFPSTFEPIPPKSEREFFDRVFLRPYEVIGPHVQVFEVQAESTAGQKTQQQSLGGLFFELVLDIFSGDPKSKSDRQSS